MYVTGSPVRLDGSTGEGGGQILRTALSLALVTGRPFEIDRIRAGRERPGIHRQHLAVVQACATIGDAAVDGLSLGSMWLSFVPGRVRAGTYVFDVGTTGSAALILQAVLPPLLLADSPSDLTLFGGTHGPSAPPFEFLERAFLPLLERMGPRVSVKLERYGFYPGPGGCIRVRVQPAPRLTGIEIPVRGEVSNRTARIVVSRLPLHVAEREAAVLVRRGIVTPAQVDIEWAEVSDSPGNSVSVALEGRWSTEVFTALGHPGLPAESVAGQVADEVEAWLAADVPVGPHLADQLLLPFALAGGGTFRTVEPTLHATSNAAVIRSFVPGGVRFDRLADGSTRVSVG